MPRTMKKHDERKKEIMQIAQKLFIENGYSKTSVGRIIDTIGIAKGTFYHYFSSKHNLMDSIVQSFVINLLEEIKPVLSNDQLNAVEKLNRIIDKSSQYKTMNPELLRTIANFMYDENNIQFRERMFKVMGKHVVPIYEQIIEQGNAEGSMDIAQPKEAAETIYYLGTYLGIQINSIFRKKNITREEFEQLTRKVNFYTKTIATILGLPADTIDFQAMDFFRKIFREQQ